MYSGNAVRQFRDFQHVIRCVPGAFDDFVELVVPELQRRGLFRSDYSGPTLRDHLGLELLPTKRIAV